MGKAEHLKISRRSISFALFCFCFYFVIQKLNIASIAGTIKCSGDSESCDTGVIENFQRDGEEQNFLKMSHPAFISPKRHELNMITFLKQYS